MGHNEISFLRESKCISFCRVHYVLGSALAKDFINWWSLFFVLGGSIMSWEGIFCTRGFILYWVFPSLTGRAHIVLKGYIMSWEGTSYIWRVHRLLGGSIIYGKGSSFTGRVHCVLSFSLIDWEGPTCTWRVNNT